MLVTSQTFIMSGSDNNIPIILARLLVFSALCLLVGPIGSRASDLADNAVATPERHSVYLGEHRLRDLIESTNAELRQTKKDFMRQILEVYTPLKSDPLVGIEKTKFRENTAAFGASLVAQDFIDIAITKHIAERRLLAGLKVAFVKFLPLRTIQRLKRLYPSYSWLNGQTQVDLRPSLNGGNEMDLSSLYSIIDARAKLRAADDVLSLTDQSIKRVIGVIDWFFVDQKSGVRDVNQLTNLARHISKVLNFYQLEIVNKKAEAERRYNALISKGRLKSLFGGEKNLVSFLDRIIDKEAIDIDLSAEANSLDLPPTITRSIVSDIVTKWIPVKILESMQEDRKAILRNGYNMKSLVHVKPELDDMDVIRLIAGQADYLRRYPNV